MFVLRPRPALQVPQYVLLRHVLLHVHVHLRRVVVRLVQHVHADLTVPHVRGRHELRRAVLPAGAEGGGLGLLYISRRSFFGVSCLTDFPYYACGWGSQGACDGFFVLY